MPASPPVANPNTWQLEQFGRAYVQAVAAAFGCSATKPDVDDDSVDLTFALKSTTGRVRSPRFEAQLKTTGQDVIDDVQIAFPLEIKNYNELRPTNLAVPRILIVVLVPQNVHQWLLQDETRLLMKKCGYWVSLYNEPATTNLSTKTVYIPRIQIFDVAAVAGIFDRLSQGLLP